MENVYQKHTEEFEVILFPFTFARITGMKKVSNNENKFEIYFDIINRNRYIEYTLKENVEKRFKFEDLDKMLNKQ